MTFIVLTSQVFWGDPVFRGDVVGNNVFFKPLIGDDVKENIFFCYAFLARYFKLSQL